MSYLTAGAAAAAAVPASADAGMNEATEVSIACYRGAGTGAILDAAPFERRFRDAMSASQHLQAMPALIEMVGRHIIGSDHVVQYI